MNELQLKLCDIQGRLFELSADNNYGSADFVKTFMTSEAAKALDSTYNRMQWAGEEYLLEELVDVAGEIRPSVIHLMRGQVFEIEGKRIFTFGGASSHDIDGGILKLDDSEFKKRKKELDKGWKPYRINHLSWWKEELTSEEEMNEGRKNLQKHNNDVDFVVTHCTSSSTAALISHGVYKPDSLTAYLEEIRQLVKFKKWFFGHYHDNRNVNVEEILLWEQIIRIL